MRDFEFLFPTRIVFKKGVFKKAGELISPFGEKFLLITGQRFAQEHGLVDALKEQLPGKRLIHFKGITPNPKVPEVEDAVSLAREEKPDAVIALGGGSVMDAAKYVAAMALSDGSPWEYATGERKFRASLPLITIPTVPASGSEADPYAVISNPETKEKRGLYSPYFWPRLALWDPILTHSLPVKIIKDGVVDIISHALEGYISGEEAILQNGFTEVIIKQVMEAWERVSSGDREAMEILCWASTLAISPFLSAGRGGHFVLHGIEHALSGVYDFISHGSGLAALLIPYLEVVGEKRPERISSLTKALFDVYHWETGISEWREWMEKQGLMQTLKGLGAEDLSLVEEKAWETSRDRLESVDLTREDLRKILEKAYD